MSIYDQFAVEPIINASGAVTRLGGAPMSEQTLAAFAEAARESVPLEQLQAAACREIIAPLRDAWHEAAATLATAPATPVVPTQRFGAETGAVSGLGVLGVG